MASKKEGPDPGFVEELIQHAKLQPRKRPKKSKGKSTADDLRDRLSGALIDLKLGDLAPEE